MNMGLVAVEDKQHIAQNCEHSQRQHVSHRERGENCDRGCVTENVFHWRWQLPCFWRRAHALSRAAVEQVTHRDSGAASIAAAEVGRAFAFTIGKSKPSAVLIAFW